MVKLYEIVTLYEYCSMTSTQKLVRAFAISRHVLHNATFIDSIFQIAPEVEVEAQNGQLTDCDTSIYFNKGKNLKNLTIVFH